MSLASIVLLFFFLADISYPQFTGPFPQLNHDIYNQIVTWTEFTILAIFFFLTNISYLQFTGPGSSGLTRA